MTGLEPAILDFGRPMPYPFGHMAFMDTGELEFKFSIQDDGEIYN